MGRPCLVSDQVTTLVTVVSPFLSSVLVSTLILKSKVRGGPGSRLSRDVYSVSPRLISVHLGCLVSCVLVPRPPVRRPFSYFVFVFTVPVLPGIPRLLPSSLPDVLSPPSLGLSWSQTQASAGLEVDTETVTKTYRGDTFQLFRVRIKRIEENSHIFPGVWGLMLLETRGC